MDAFNGDLFVLQVSAHGAKLVFESRDMACRGLVIWPASGSPACLRTFKAKTCEACSGVVRHMIGVTVGVVDM